MEDFTAIVLGPTGLVGGYVIDQLLDHKEYKRTKVLHRRMVDKAHGKLVQHEIDFDDLNNHKELFQADHLYCCLGTTIKKAGSNEAFRKVDFDYAINTAKIAQEQGVKKFIVVSSIGANPKSKIFYNRLKGEMEEAVKEIGFESTGIFRPSILDGPRKEKRPAEQTGLTLMKALSFAFIGKFKRYRPIHAETVATAMVKFGVSPNEGVHVFESDEIKEIA